MADPKPDVPDDVLNVDTIASEVHGLQHSMRQMTRSDAEMAEMLEHPDQHGLDADDVQELKLALKENVGVMYVLFSLWASVLMMSCSAY